MMILEIPGRHPGAARLGRLRRVSRDFASHGLAPYSLRAGSKPCPRVWSGSPRPAEPASSPRAAPGNAPLASLADQPLLRRFHSWSGRSGRRYVCSVFPAEFEQPGAGLPDFSGALVLAVAVAADGLRSPLALHDSGEGDAASHDRRRMFLATAQALGACEWHVYLLATEAGHRRLVMADLAVMTDLAGTDLAGTACAAAADDVPALLQGVFDPAA